MSGILSNGSTSRYYCLCNAGYYGTSGGAANENGSCSACADGHKCPNGNVPQTPCGNNAYPAAGATSCSPREAGDINLPDVVELAQVWHALGGISVLQDNIATQA